MKLDSLFEETPEEIAERERAERERLKQEEIAKYKNSMPIPQELMRASDSVARFKGADWFEKIKKVQVSVIGVGGIGSHFVFDLARASVGNIIIYDDDVIDAGNMAGQMYRTSDIGSTKVYAMANLCRDFCPTVNITTYNTKYRNQSLSPITVTALDNMKARKIVFENWYEQFKNVPDIIKYKYLFIDGRMSAEGWQIFCFRLDQEKEIKNYMKEALFDDNEGDAPLCSYKATTFCGSNIASFMMAILVSHLRFDFHTNVFRDNVYFYNEWDSMFGIHQKRLREWKKKKKVIDNGLEGEDTHDS